MMMKPDGDELDLSVLLYSPPLLFPAEQAVAPAPWTEQSSERGDDPP